MKKVITVLLAICLTMAAFFTLSACSNDPPTGGSDDGWMEKYY